MKKITLIIALAITTTSLFAQTGNSYLMMNLNLKSNNDMGYYRWPYRNRHAVFPIGLQYIKADSKNSALRFGFTLFENNLYGKNSNYSIGDTFYQKQNIYETLLPKVTFGKEWRKQIHKDIAIYAGADLGFGLMKNPKMLYETKYTNNGYGGGYSIGQIGSKFIMNISARPFIGIRTDWNRFVIGYEASLPINYTQVLGENVKKVDGFKLQHQLSLGYKLGKKTK